MIGLKERGVVTGQELRMARERYERAREERQRADLNLQRAFLNSLADATHLTVVNGQKYGVEGDKVRVRLTLRNDSDLNLAQMVDHARRRYEINGLDQDAASLLQVNNIFVTILADNVMVGQPYQVHIPVLALGEEVEVEVGLQRPEVEDLTVQLQYLNRTDEHVIHLEKASARDVVRVYATQFSQEGPLGNSVAYELQLERLAEDEKIFQLMAHGLPDDFRWEFESGGRNLSRLRFSRDHSSDSLILNVYVPRTSRELYGGSADPVLGAGLRAKDRGRRGFGRGRSRALASHGHWLRATATGAHGSGRIGAYYPQPRPLGEWRRRVAVRLAATQPRHG